MSKRIAIILFAVVIPIVSLLSLPLFLPSPQTAQAQSGAIFVDKQLGRANPIVGVGEYLTFTILIENQSAFTVTTLPLSDTFNTAVLAFVDAVPMPDTSDEAAGRLDWTDLTTFFGDLAPGQQIAVVTGFIAEHPETAVVNQAEVHDVIGSAGALGGSDDTDNGTDSVGGSLPLNKRLADDVTAAAGLPLTFTISITNDGYTTATVIPLSENYDPTVIQFNFAVPPPDIIDTITGSLTWTDITSYTGDLPAFASVDVTVVFTALLPFDNTINQASISGAVDWYGNDLAGGADAVPITIIGPTATAVPTKTPRPSSPAAAPTATPILMPTPTATAVPAAAFPETGIPPVDVSPLTAVFALIAAVLPVAIWMWQRRRS